MNKSFFTNRDNNGKCCNDTNKQTSYYKDINNCNCYKYIIGTPRPTGPTGATGSTGAAGTNGILNFADFYALMPQDNASTVAPGTDVSFPQDGPNSGSGISRIGDDSFNLGDIGTYQIFFQVFFK